MSTLTPTKETEIEEISVEDAARLLIGFATEGEPTLSKVYLFPSEDQIRLIEVDPDAPRLRNGDQIAPFYFNPSPEDGMPYWSAIAIIRPEEAEVYAPPADWGDWKEAKVLWEAS